MAWKKNNRTRTAPVSMSEESEEGVMFCPGCGGEYRAGFSRCVDCELDLIPERPLPPEPVEAGLAPFEQGAGEEDWDDEEELEEAAVAAAPYPHPVPRDLPENRLRAWELALVLLVAFSSSLFSSTRDWWTGRTGAGELTVLGALYGIQKQLVCLGLLAYVLSRRKRGFRDLGLDFRPADIPAGVLLTVAVFLARLLAFRGMHWVAIVFTGHPAVAHSHRAEPIPGLMFGSLNLLYSVIDPIYEEMIARAFVMTEVEALTGSTGIAILASVALQTSYHLYQGTTSALSAGAMFLVYACFYARFRRITPVILSHICWDLVLTLKQL